MSSPKAKAMRRTNIPLLLVATILATSCAKPAPIPAHSSKSMRRSLAAVALWAASLFTACTPASLPVADASATTQQITRAGTQPTSVGPAEYFTGQVRVDPLFPRDSDINASGAYVTFEPGARSAWHTHPAGQRLVVISGVGLTQEWGKPAQEIRVGDVVWCPPGVKHWHGAGPSAAMTHLAVSGAVGGKSVTWLEKMTEEQYKAAVASAQASKKTTTDGPLSAKQRAIPLIAAAMAVSDMPRLSAALGHGLDAGLTISEAKEILVHLYAYVGFPRSLNALGELMRVVEARKKRGIEDSLGRDPSREPPVGDALVAIGTTNQTKISGAPVKGAVFEFAPIINRFLQAHLFGDIFERDNLDWQSRELATVGALAATPGVESQLRSHVAASMRVGLTARQLELVVEALNDTGHADAARRAATVLAASQRRPE